MTWHLDIGINEIPCKIRCLFKFVNNIKQQRRSSVNILGGSSSTVIFKWVISKIVIEISKMIQKYRSMQTN